MQLTKDRWLVILQLKDKGILKLSDDETVIYVNY